MSSVAPSLEKATIASAAVVIPQTQSAIIQVPASGIPVRVMEGPSDWLTPTLQIVVAIFSAAASAAAIIWQMRKQSEQAEQQHRKAVKADLRLDAYRDFQHVYAPLTQTWVPSAGLTAVRTAVGIAVEQLRRTGHQLPVLERTDQFMQHVNGYRDKALALIFFIERYESLLPGFDIFRTAISAALRDVGQLLLPVQDTLLKWLPMEHPQSTTTAHQFLSIPVITEAAQVEINAALAPLDIALGRLTCWTVDLSVDIQNTLLGHYAEQKVKQRVASDQTFFTVTAASEQRARLDALFAAMPWGRASGTHE
ncbi:hypothetical protein [Paraburkholderia sp. RL17-347-BIC-D]|uniref:hypothetical protein n=1 Tax=Paraburkholderia sp. RL17-347-BIC-D TaxID=3031632 RepID=UPI0038B97ED9